MAEDPEYANLEDELNNDPENNQPVNNQQEEEAPQQGKKPANPKVIVATLIFKLMGMLP